MSPKPRITLHHLRFSRGSRIFWVLEELELPYDAVVYSMDSGAPYASSMKAATPLAKSPALYIDDELIYESGAIITELLARFPHAGIESASSSKSTFWGYFSEGSVMLFFQPARFLGMGNAQIKKNMSDEEKKGADALQEWMNGWSDSHIKLAMDEVEKYLGEQQWFSGSDKLGLGDFMMLTPILAVAGLKKPNLAMGPNTQAWVKRVRARPAFKRAMARMKDEENKQTNKGKL